MSSPTITDATPKPSEPVTGLDLISQQRIATAVMEEKAAGRDVLISTHDLGEAGRTDVVVLLSGRIVASGLPAGVLTRSHLQAADGHQLSPTSFSVCSATMPPPR